MLDLLSHSKWEKGPQSSAPLSTHCCSCWESPWHAPFSRRCGCWLSGSSRLCPLPAQHPRTDTRTASPSTPSVPWSARHPAKTATTALAPDVAGHTQCPWPFCYTQGTVITILQGTEARKELALPDMLK